MSKNNVRSPFIENKHHVKLYKKGKNWVAMGITMATLAGVSFALNTNASAAENTANDPASTISQESPASQPTDTNNSATSNTGDSSTVTPKSTDQSQLTETPGSANSNATAQPVALAAPSTEPAPEVPTQTASPIVTTNDPSGVASTDPANTGHSNTAPSVITGDKVASHFVTGGQSGGSTLPKISSDTADLTDPTNKSHVQNGAIVAKDAIDFNTNFSLNATVNIKWDSTNMGTWLGGDGTAVAFQPVSTNDALTQGGYGSQMGLVQNVPGTISYIISTDAVGQSPSTSDGTHYQSNRHWIIYQSGSDSKQATGGVYDTGIAVPTTDGISTPVTGSLSYTFDVKYTADNKQLVTNVRAGGADGAIVKTFNRTISDDQIGENYVLGVTAATASSKAAYSVTINNYTYVPADAKLAITSNMPNIAQSDINGTPGQVIGFYQSGTDAPTTDGKGNAVSVAYAVPDVQGYHLSSSQFITLASGGENNIALNYVGDSVKADVTISSNKGSQTVANVSGIVGQTVTVSVPDVPGYTPDKSTVTATVNSDGTITVVTPDTQTGNAGYVTYTGDTQKLIVKIGNWDNAPTLTVTGASDSPITYDADAIINLIPDGYTLPSYTSKTDFANALKVGNAPITFDHDTQTDQTWTLLLVPAESFNSTTTTRTIHFMNTNGQTISPDVVQTLNWIQPVDAATKKPTDVYSAIGGYPSITTPTLEGYTTTTASIAVSYPLINDNPTSTEETVTYVGDPITATVSIPSNKGNQTSAPISGKVGDTVQVPVPSVAGYTADKDAVSATINPNGTITVDTPNSKPDDANFVTYTADTQTVNIKVGDHTWTTTGPSDSKVNYDEKAITALIPKGYTIESSYTNLSDLLNAFAPATFDHDTANDQNFVITLAHALTYNSETTTRTIHFVDQSGKTLSPDVVQTVNWLRVTDGTTDPTQGAYSPMDWYTSVNAPTIDGYTPDKASVAADYPMITDKPANATDITIVYTGNQIKADVSIPSNQGSQIVTNVSGQVGETVSVPVPPINGYTADKTTVSATVNPDGTITVNAPKDKPGDAGYVTYTANSTNSDSTGQPGDDNGNPGNTDNTPQTGNETSPTDETTQPGMVPTDSNNETDPTQNESGSKPVSQNGGQSVDQGTAVGTGTTHTAVTGSSVAASNQQTVTQLSHSQATAGQSATGQLPQTNEQSDQAKTAGVLGLMMLSLLSLFGLKRKETDGK